MKNIIHNVVTNGTQVLIDDANENTDRLKEIYQKLCSQQGIDPEEWDGQVYRQSLELGSGLDEALSREAFYEGKIRSLAMN